MKFVQRVHYCPKCEKNVYFLKRTNKENIKEDHSCLRCQTEVISFWEILSNKFILPYLIGTPFFAASVVYAFWTSTVGSIRPVDIFILIINVVIASIIVVSGMRYKRKPTIPPSSIKTVDEIRIMKYQNLWSVLFVFIGCILALIVDVALYFIWIGIESVL